MPIVRTRKINMHAEKPNENVDHAFAEVHLGGQWVHADPTWDAFDASNAYLGWLNIVCKVEKSSYIKIPDLVTVKYAVGLENSERPVTVWVDNNGDGSGQVRFWNRARQHQSLDFSACDFSVQVIDNGGIPWVQVGGLSGGNVLSPGERDYATLRVEGAIWDVYYIDLKITYNAVNGETCSKIYSDIKVEVER